MRARYGAGWSIFRSAWVRTGVVLVVSGGVAGGQSPASAEEPDCRTISGRPLTITIITDANERRQIKLGTGDTLAFELQAGGGTWGIVALTRGNGPERALLDGPDGAKARFVAAEPGSFDLRFESRGGAPATFKTTCRPADRRTAEKRPRGAGRFAKLPADIAIEVPVEGDGSPIADLTFETPSITMPNAEVPGFAAPLPKDPDTGLAFNMDLREHRYVPGPYGVQVDPLASGVNVGVNYKPQPAIMVGALAQFEQATPTVVGGPAPDLTDKAWMAGPVTKLQLAPGVALDAKAAWGYADTSALDFSAHAPSMPRGLVSARLSNTQTFGGWRLTPSVNVNHSWDTAVAPGSSATDAFVTSTVTAGRVDVGPELAYRLDLSKAAFIEPRVAVGTFWGLDGLSGVAHPVQGDMRLKAEAGVTFGMSDGAKLQMGGAIEEGGGTAPDTWSGRVQMSVPLK